MIDCGHRSIYRFLRIERSIDCIIDRPIMNFETNGAHNYVAGGRTRGHSRNSAPRTLVRPSVCPSVRRDESGEKVFVRKLA